MSSGCTRVVSHNSKLTLRNLLPLEPNITCLHIEHCRSSNWPEIFEELTRNKRLSELKISHCLLTRQDMMLLHSFDSVKTLCLDGNLLDEHLADELEHLPKLQSLSLVGNPNVKLEAFLRIIQNAPSLTKLYCPIPGQTTLKITQTQITEYIPEMIRDNFPSLTTLTLELCGIDSEEAAFIAEGFPAIRSLNLNNNNIASQGISKLARYLPPLNTLCLDNNPIGSEGAANLAFLPQLNNISCCDCKIGDEGMLSYLHASSKLKVLTASRNRLGLRTFPEVCRQQPTLKQLNFQNNLTIVVPKALKSMLPHTQLNIN